MCAWFPIFPLSYLSYALDTSKGIQTWQLLLCWWESSLLESLLTWAMFCWHVVTLPPQSSRSSMGELFWLLRAQGFSDPGITRSYWFKGSSLFELPVYTGCFAPGVWPDWQNDKHLIVPCCLHLWVFSASLKTASSVVWLIDLEALHIFFFFLQVENFRHILLQY